MHGSGGGELERDEVADIVGVIVSVGLWLAVIVAVCEAEDPNDSVDVRLAVSVLLAVAVIDAVRVLEAVGTKPSGSSDVVQ